MIDRGIESPNEPGSNKPELTSAHMIAIVDDRLKNGFEQDDSGPRRPLSFIAGRRDTTLGEPVYHGFGPGGEISKGAESIRLTIPPEIIIICGSKGFLAAKFISVMIGGEHERRRSPR
jgi:hypothetical protein